jgi:Spy/CpxP family protein refolding chaperone
MLGTVGVRIFAVSLVCAQPPVGALGRPEGSVRTDAILLMYENVQKELKLTEEQVLKAKEAFQTTRKQHQADFEKLRTVGVEERGPKAIELMKLVSDETMMKLKGVLTHEQLKRLSQLRLQVQGPGAFENDRVVKELKLTAEQQEKVKTILRADRLEIAELFQGGVGRGGNFQAALSRLTVLRKETVEKILTLLTPEQRKTWKELTGVPFELKLEPRSFR